MPYVVSYRPFPLVALALQLPRTIQSTALGNDRLVVGGGSRLRGHGGNMLPNASISSALDPWKFSYGHGRSSWMTSDDLPKSSPVFNTQPSDQQYIQLFSSPLYANVWAMQGSNPGQLATLQSTYASLCQANPTKNMTHNVNSSGLIGAAFGVLYAVQNLTLANIEPNFTRCIQDNSDAHWAINESFLGVVIGGTLGFVALLLGCLYCCCGRKETLRDQDLGIPQDHQGRTVSWITIRLERVLEPVAEHPAEEHASEEDEPPAYSSSQTSA